MLEFLQTLLLEIVKSIHWGEVLTSLINTILYLCIPLFLEWSTGVLRASSTYLEANKENSWMLQFMADIATTMDAQWQIEAKDIRKAWDEGRLTQEEWDKQKQELKDGFNKKMLLKLQKYPAAYAKKFEGEIEDQMEAYLAKNKKIEALTKAIKENTSIQDPELINALKSFAEKQKK